MMPFHRKLSCYFLLGSLKVLELQIHKGEIKKTISSSSFLPMETRVTVIHWDSIMQVMLIVLHGCVDAALPLNMQATPGFRTEKYLFQMNINSTKVALQRAHKQVTLKQFCILNLCLRSCRWKTHRISTCTLLQIRCWQTWIFIFASQFRRQSRQCQQFKTSSEI